VKRAILMTVCAVLVLQGSIAAQESRAAKRYEVIATLGATTRAPTEEEVEKRELPFSVRAQGQVVVDVTRGGAAEKAGIMRDDVILKFGTNKVFSQDDIADYLRVQKPKDRVILKCYTKPASMTDLRTEKSRMSARTARREAEVTDAGTGMQRIVYGMPALTARMSVQRLKD